MLEIQSSGELPEIEVVYVVHDDCEQQSGHFQTAMMAVMLCTIFTYLAYVAWQISFISQYASPPIIP